LTNSITYQAHYSVEEMEWHIRFFEEQEWKLQNDTPGVGRKYLLEMYANPLINANSYQ
jgi:hypothetical protein